MPCRPAGGCSQRSSLRGRGCWTGRAARPRCLLPVPQIPAHIGPNPATTPQQQTPPFLADSRDLRVLRFYELKQANFLERRLRGGGRRDNCVVFTSPRKKKTQKLLTDGDYASQRANAETSGWSEHWPSVICSRWLIENRAVHVHNKTSLSVEGMWTAEIEVIRSAYEALCLCELGGMWPSVKEMPVNLVTRCHFPQALPLRFGRFAMNSQ